jgi:hypothetical protein
MDYIGLHHSNKFDKNYWGSGNYIKNAINKYGKENFEQYVLLEANDDEELNSFEYQMIEQLETMYPNGYNLVEGGNNPVKSLEARKNQSHITKEETKQKISKKNLGKKRSKEQKEFIRQRTKEAMSKMKNKEKLAYWKGKKNTKHSEWMKQACKEGKIRNSMTNFTKCSCGKIVYDIQMKRHLEFNHLKFGHF